MSDLPQITINGLGLDAMPFLLDEELKKDDTTTVFWFDPSQIQDDPPLPSPSSPELTIPLPPSPTVSPASPALSSSSTSYGNEQALPSPSNLSLDIPHAEQPMGWGAWVHECKEVSNAMAYRSPQEDANSNFAEDALSTSPGSGPHDDSYSPASSPGIQNMPLHMETLFADHFSLQATTPDYLSSGWEGHSGNQPSTSVPSSPHLLPNAIPLMRSRSHRALGHQYSASDSSFLSVASAAPVGANSGPFLETSDRGRGRSRAFTAPSSRRPSPYPQPGRPPSSQDYSLAEMENFLSFSHPHHLLQQRPEALSINTQLHIPDHPYLSPPGTSEDGFSPPPDSAHSPADSSVSESPAVSKRVVTTTKTRLASEIKRKHEQKFECAICLERFTTKNKRDRHIDAHQGIKRFPCERHGCTKAFTSSADRKRHQENPKHP